MYIFTRARTIDPGRGNEALAGAVELTAKINEVIDVPVTAWYQQYALTGPAINWTARLDHLEDLDRTMAELRASTDVQDLMAELDESLIGPVVDNMIEIIAGTPPTTATPVVSTVQATAANGHYRAAVHWGADLAERFGTSMNVPTIFARGLYGNYGTILWASYCDDMNQLEGTHAKLATDEMLMAVMDEGAHNCAPGAVAMTMHRLD